MTRPDYDQLQNELAEDDFWTRHREHERRLDERVKRGRCRYCNEPGGVGWWTKYGVCMECVGDIK